MVDIHWQWKEPYISDQLILVLPEALLHISFIIITIRQALVSIGKKSELNSIISKIPYISRILNIIDNLVIKYGLTRL